MITNKTELRKCLNDDYKALFLNRRGGIIERIKNPVLKFERHLRYCEYYRNTAKRSPYYNPFYLFHKIRLHNLGIKLGFSIPENCFGYGLSIAHYGTIVVNPNVRVGSDCRIHTGVNIGANKDAFDVPVIGNHVYIGPGAKIFGKITIGNNVKIGANAVVLKDAPDNAVLVGIPARNISEEKQEDCDGR